MGLQLTDKYRFAKLATRSVLYLSILLAIIGGVWMHRQSNASALTGSLDGTSFITTWKTDNPGSSNDTSVSIPINSPWGSSYDIDWDNDGIYDEFDLTNGATHDYGTPGVYTIRVQSENIRILMSESFGDSQKLLEVNQWGNTSWWTMEDAFRGASNMVITATDAPDLSGVTTTDMMFAFASSLTGDLSGWDVSSLTNTSYMFYEASSFNSDLSSWDVSNAVNMEVMFGGATSFNSDLSSWNVSSATSMLGMFQSATSFNSDLSSWNVSNVTWFDGMFSGASSFNSDLSSWDVSNAIYMDHMLRNSGLSVENYDAILEGWAAQPVQSGISFAAFPTCYSEAGAARTFLADEMGWQINDGGDCSDVSERAIESVNFSEDDGKLYLIVEGNKLSSGVASEVFFTPYVRLNGAALPTCINGLGTTVEELTTSLESTAQMFSATVNISMDPPCLLFVTITESGPLYEITSERIVIWLPSDFDTTQPGVVTVSELNMDKMMNEFEIEMINPLSYEFNSPDSPEGLSIVVDGGSISNTPAISNRPTFSGTATPGATVTVTVHSDPVSCTTTADQNGNWSCTLPSDLVAGAHNVYVTVVNLDASVQEFGPYAVTVDGVSAGVIDNNTPGAPNTGFLAENVAVIKQLDSESQSVLISTFALSGVVAALLAGGVVFGGGKVLRSLRKSLNK